MGVCVCVGHMCVFVHTVFNVQFFFAGAIRERTGEAEEGVGESTAGGAGGGEKTQRRGTVTH